MTYPNGERAEYQYNEKGQLSKLHTEQGCIQYRYDDLGNLIRKELPNGIVTSYSYNLLGRIREINHTGKDFAEQYSYQYDALGNKVSINKKRYGFEADSGHFEYGYDALNRLTSVRRDGSFNFI